ncbi:dihydrodipicolinate reductase [Paenibacillus terrae]|uniref:NAD(P)H-dependent amine dehydrogenase family protein n=1 Tax=Paenibacillus terrae TaxID=159743 RepID=UPI0011EB24A5|nr:dihydrodipicolinate reductase [Paenibacillus terrae]
MERKVRAAQYGCGKMSVYLIRYLLEKGADIVAAFDVNPAVIGKDIGEVIGYGRTLGVKVSDIKDADQVLSELKPDVCVIATLSTMADIKTALTVCAKNGVNAISTAEESLYPWVSSPAVTEELDELAKNNNCTLSGSGYPDMYWGVLVDTLAGSLHKITKIKGISSYNVEDYGIALAEGHGAGLTPTEFAEQIGKFNDLNSNEIREKIENGEVTPSYMWYQNGWLCSRMGLTPISQTQKCIPMTHDRDLESSTLGMTIKAGNATGMAAVVTTETAEGIVIETQCIGKVYASEEFDKNEWSFYGEPEVTINVDRPATVQLTCANLVNRIPALINSEPGYVTTDKLPNNAYLVKPLNEYINF